MTCWTTASCDQVIYFLKQWRVKIICSSNWWEDIPGDRLLSCPHLSPLRPELVWEVFWLCRRSTEVIYGVTCWKGKCKDTCWVLLILGIMRKQRKETNTKEEREEQHGAISLLQERSDNDGCSPGERGVKHRRGSNRITPLRPINPWELPFRDAITPCTRLYPVVAMKPKRGSICPSVRQAVYYFSQT